MVASWRILGTTFDVRTFYHMLKEKTPYRARGAEEYLHKDHERQIRQ